MKKAFLCFLAFCVLFGTVPVSAAGGFSDVDPAAYYAQAVEWAVEREITSGTASNAFSPGVSCTRAQILTFLWRAAGKPEALLESGAADVPAGAYYEDAVRWGRSAGLFSGDTFRPQAPCTRAMAVEFLWRAMGCPEASKAAVFSDVPASGGDTAAAVAWAVEQGVTGGTSATEFSPGKTCTRAQIVTFLYRAYAGQTAQNPGGTAVNPDASGKTPVTDMAETGGTYANSRYTVLIEPAAAGIHFEILLTANPDSGPALEGGLKAFEENGTLVAAWNGLKMTFYQDSLILEAPEKYSAMNGAYTKQ